MEAKKFVTFKKEELGVKDYVKEELGKGRISDVSIEYTPIGEKIIISTSKPGLVIGRKGEKVELLTRTLKRRFKLDNPHIEIEEIREPRLDAQLVADEIALLLERRGSLKFKVVAYRMLRDIMKAGALGTEIVLSGKLPSDRARTWRFNQGYLKKTGEPSKVVDSKQAQAKTVQGIVGIMVSILPPDAHIHDKIVVDEALRAKVRLNVLEAAGEVPVEEKSDVKKKSVSKKRVEKSVLNESASEDVVVEKPVDEKPTEEVVEEPVEESKNEEAAK